MARTNLKVLSVYLDEKHHKRIKKAATRENRTMSNYAGEVVSVAAENELAAVDVRRAIEQFVAKK